MAGRDWEIFPFDEDLPLEHFAQALAGTTHLMSSVPPGEAGDPVIALHGADIARNGGLQWAGYLSTTGVYGDRQGGEVDESSERIPASRARPAQGHGRGCLA